MPGIIWIAVIGLVAGLIARFLLPGPNNPPTLLVTMVLEIAGAFVATFIGQSIGGIGGLIRAQDCSVRRLVRSLCCLSGTD